MAGVTDAFLDAGIEFPYVVGTSSGALIGFNLISRESGRAKKIIIEGMPNPHFASFRNLIKNHNYFDFEYLFKTMPKEVISFDQETFDNSKVKFFCGTTGVEDGLPHYFEKNHPEFLAAASASSTLPFLGRPIRVDGKPYMDGGTVCAMPFRKPIEDGVEKIVVVFTRTRDYRKDAPNWKKRFFYWFKYHKHKKYHEALKNSWWMYNEDVEEMLRLEKEGKAFLIFPKDPPPIGRGEKNPQKLNDFYETGYKAGQDCLADLRRFLGE